MTDRDLLLQAVHLAGESSRDGRHGPFGAIVARGDAIVGRGWNRVVAARDPTAHAEIEAIREACRSLGTHVLDDCVLYSSAEPCPLCLSATYWARIPRVVYASTRAEAAGAGFDDLLIYEEIARPWNRRRIIGVHHPLAEATAVLEAWLANPDRVPY